MPRLAQLARFGGGGRVIAAVVAEGGVRGRRGIHLLHKLHILHVRTVLVLHSHAGTDLQGKCNAQNGKRYGQKSSHRTSLARHCQFVTGKVLVWC